VLRKIAQAGLSGLSGMINGTSPVDAPPSPAPAPAGKRGPAVASAQPPVPASGEFSVSALGYSEH
jgi:hypothetical protein